MGVTFPHIFRYIPYARWSGWNHKEHWEHDNLLNQLLGGGLGPAIALSRCDWRWDMVGLGAASNKRWGCGCFLFHPIWRCPNMAVPQNHGSSILIHGNSWQFMVILMRTGCGVLWLRIPPTGHLHRENDDPTGWCQPRLGGKTAHGVPVVSIVTGMEKDPTMVQYYRLVS